MAFAGFEVFLNPSSFDLVFIFTVFKTVSSSNSCNSIFKHLPAD